jgi:hypothetical protein
MLRARGGNLRRLEDGGGREVSRFEEAEQEIFVLVEMRQRCTEEGVVIKRFQSSILVTDRPRP